MVDFPIIYGLILDGNCFYLDVFPDAASCSRKAKGGAGAHPAPSDPLFHLNFVVDFMHFNVCAWRTDPWDISADFPVSFCRPPLR